MEHFTFENQWDSIKGQLKQRYAQLTDDDVAFAEGKGEELLARLREKLGFTPSDLDALLDELKVNATGGMAQAKAKVADLAEGVRAKVGAAVEEVKAKGSAAADEVKAQAEVAYDVARKRARNLMDDGGEYVRRNPRESLVAAVCAGFVAGLLIRR